MNPNYHLDEDLAEDKIKLDGLFFIEWMNDCSEDEICVVFKRDDEHTRMTDDNNSCLYTKVPIESQINYSNTFFEETNYVVHDEPNILGTNNFCIYEQKIFKCLVGSLSNNSRRSTENISNLSEMLIEVFINIRKEVMSMFRMSLLGNIHVNMERLCFSIEYVNNLIVMVENIVKDDSEESIWCVNTVIDFYFGFGRKILIDVLDFTFQETSVIEENNPKISMVIKLESYFIIWCLHPLKWAINYANLYLDVDSIYCRMNNILMYILKRNFSTFSSNLICRNHFYLEFVNLVINLSIRFDLKLHANNSSDGRFIKIFIDLMKFKHILDLNTRKNKLEVKDAIDNGWSLLKYKDQLASQIRKEWIVFRLFYSCLIKFMTENEIEKQKLSVMVQNSIWTYIEEIVCINHKSWKTENILVLNVLVDINVILDFCLLLVKAWGVFPSLGLICCLYEFFKEVRFNIPGPFIYGDNEKLEFSIRENYLILIDLYCKTNFGSISDSKKTSEFDKFLSKFITFIETSTPISKGQYDNILITKGINNGFSKFTLSSIGFIYEIHLLLSRYSQNDIKSISTILNAFLLTQDIKKPTFESHIDKDNILIELKLPALFVNNLLNILEIQVSNFIHIKGTEDAGVLEKIISRITLVLCNNLNHFVHLYSDIIAIFNNAEENVFTVESLFKNEPKEYMCVYGLKVNTFKSKFLDNEKMKSISPTCLTAFINIYKNELPHVISELLDMFEYKVQKIFETNSHYGLVIMAEFVKSVLTLNILDTDLMIDGKVRLSGLRITIIYLGILVDKKEYITEHCHKTYRSLNEDIYKNITNLIDLPFVKSNGFNARNVRQGKSLSQGEYWGFLFKIIPLLYDVGIIGGCKVLFEVFGVKSKYFRTNKLGLEGRKVSYQFIYELLSYDKKSFISYFSYRIQLFELWSSLMMELDDPLQIKLSKLILSSLFLYETSTIDNENNSFKSKEYSIMLVLNKLKREFVERRNFLSDDNTILKRLEKEEEVIIILAMLRSISECHKNIINENQILTDDYNRYFYETICIILKEFGKFINSHVYKDYQSQYIIDEILFQIDTNIIYNHVSFEKLLLLFASLEYFDNKFIFQLILKVFRVYFEKSAANNEDINVQKWSFLLFTVDKYQNEHVGNTLRFRQFLLFYYFKQYLDSKSNRIFIIFLTKILRGWILYIFDFCVKYKMEIIEIKDQLYDILLFFHHILRSISKYLSIDNNGICFLEYFVVLCYFLDLSDYIYVESEWIYNAEIRNFLNGIIESVCLYSKHIVYNHMSDSCLSTGTLGRYGFNVKDLEFEINDEFIFFPENDFLFATSDNEGKYKMSKSTYLAHILKLWKNLSNSASIYSSERIKKDIFEYKLLSTRRLINKKRKYIH